MHVRDSSNAWTRVRSLVEYTQNKCDLKQKLFHGVCLMLLQSRKTLFISIQLSPWLFFFTNPASSSPVSLSVSQFCFLFRVKIVIHPFKTKINYCSGKWQLHRSSISHMVLHALSTIITRPNKCLWMQMLLTHHWAHTYIHRNIHKYKTRINQTKEGIKPSLRSLCRFIFYSLF